jgi:hypothetical protein
VSAEPLDPPPLTDDVMPGSEPFPGMPPPPPEPETAGRVGPPVPPQRGGIGGGRRRATKKSATAPRAPGRRPGPKPGSAATRKAPDYRPAVVGLLQIPTTLLAMAGAAGNPVLAADAAVLDAGTPALAEAVHQVASAEPRVAQLLDKLTTAGPYAAIFAATTPIVMQLLANHRVVPPGMFGTVDMVPTDPAGPGGPQQPGDDQPTPPWGTAGAM